MDSRGYSRRGLLRLGAGAVGLGTTGVAAGDTDLGRYNVGYASSGGRLAAVAAADELIHDLTRIDAVTILATSSTASELSRRGGIRYVERDGHVEAIDQLLPGDGSIPFVNDQQVPWGVDRIGAPEVHGDHTGGAASVAIVDTGIDQTHLDLADNVAGGTAFVGGQQHPVWQDTNGHGTHCAGIAGAIDNSQGVLGVAPSVDLYAVKTLNAAGAGLSSDVAAGVLWAAEQDIDVVSLSLGGADSQTLHDAVDEAADSGVFVAAAAGNSGTCTDCVSFPAAYDSTIAVTATNQDDGFASISSQGPEVELAAPGMQIRSTYLANSYQQLSGTSMAAPHVAGAAALLMAEGRTASQARDELGATAEDIGLSENQSGHGLVNVDGALGS